MEAKPEAFGVLWEDRMLGFLSLSKPDAASALETAKALRKHPYIKTAVAVHVPEGSDDLVELEE